MKEDGYKYAVLNVEIFGSKSKQTLEDYFESTRYFFDRTWLPENFTMLDIGGSSGCLIEAIKDAGFEVEGTVIDPDPRSIHEGRRLYPSNNYIQDYFPPEKWLEDNSYELVSMQALFPQIPLWKECVLEMCRVARKFVNLSLTFKLDGTTVIDKDVSYFYYLDGNERVHQIIHNIYEFVNFLCIHELRVKKIFFYGYHTPYSGHNFRCVPNSKQIKGNIFLELFEPGEEYPVRMGGAVDYGVGIQKYKFFRPETKIIIDDEHFDIFEAG